MNLLTAEQMAKQLGMSVKTFYKRVRKYRVPFIHSRQKLFNPEKVLCCLETTIPETKQIEPKRKTRGRGLVLPNNKYREILGLSID